MNSCPTLCRSPDYSEAHPCTLIKTSHFVLFWAFIQAWSHQSCHWLLSKPTGFSRRKNLSDLCAQDCGYQTFLLRNFEVTAEKNPKRAHVSKRNIVLNSDEDTNREKKTFNLFFSWVQGRKIKSGFSQKGLTATISLQFKCIVRRGDGTKPACVMCSRSLDFQIQPYLYCYTTNRLEKHRVKKSANK